MVLLRNCIYNSIKNFELEHGERIEVVYNSLMNRYDRLGANCFADYAGIKKDKIEGGGGISPGFIFYDAVQNNFFGYKGSEARELVDFENIFFPLYYGQMRRRVCKAMNWNIFPPITRAGK